MQSKALDPRCVVHGDDAAVCRCHSCARALCLRCCTHRVDDKPWCTGCATLLSRPAPVVHYLAAAGFLSLLVGLVSWQQGAFSIGWWLVASASAALAVYLAYRRTEKRRAAMVIEALDIEQARPMAQAATPYRGGLKRVAKAITPPISGSLATLTVGSAMLLALALMPGALTMPLWIELEVVILAWVLIWTLAFTTLLFRGWRLAKDAWTKDASTLDDVTMLNVDLDLSTRRSWWYDDEGAAIAVFLFVVLLILSFALEFLLPLVLIGSYLLVLRGLAHVANDRHGCEGKLGRSLLWGVLWSSIYAAPIAGLVLLAHLLMS